MGFTITDRLDCIEGRLSKASDAIHDRLDAVAAKLRGE